MARETGSETEMTSRETAPEAPVLRIYPFEVAAVLGLVAAVIFLRFHGLRIGWQTVEWTIYPMFPSLPWNFLIGIVSVALYRLATRAPLGSYLRRILTPSWLVMWLRLWLACMLMGYVYFWLKINIPLINYRLWDAELWQLDVLLHLGVSPSILVTQLFEGTFLVAVFDRWYSWWIPSVILTMSFFSAFTEERQRSAFMLACVLLWMAGAWLYMSLPALGPIYVFPQPWTNIHDAMPLAQGGHRALWENYQIMLAGRTGQIFEFNPTRGIAAMPSLHVAAHGLFALWSWRFARPLFVPLLLATLLTFIGSVLTGWHYAVDGYVGLLMAYGCYRLALWWGGVGAAKGDDNAG